MSLDDARYEEIKQEVVFLFTLYRIHCIPISGIDLAARMGIMLVPYSSLESHVYDRSFNRSSPKKMTKAMKKHFKKY